MSPLEKLLLVIVVPTILLLVLTEAIILSQRQQYDWRAFCVSVMDLILRIVLRALLPLSIATPLVYWAFSHRLTTLQLDGWLPVLLLFLGQEFCYYWYHRAAHTTRWFWCNHAVHHSPDELNLSAALRIGILGKFSGTAVFFIPLIWFGFDPQLVLASLTLNLLYQFWIHATWIPRLGFLEGILNTPSSHRVHHAVNIEYLDANFGGVLIIFDRLFGTYVKERDDLPCRYGLLHPPGSHNFFQIEFFGWMSLLRDLSAARSARSVLGYLFMPPGWVPHGEGNTTQELRARHLANPVTNSKC